MNLQVEKTNAAKTKKACLRAKLEDGSLKILAGQKSAAKRRSKLLVGHKFVKMSALATGKLHQCSSTRHRRLTALPDTAAPKTTEFGISIMVIPALLL